jgi:hypothetical protein
MAAGERCPGSRRTLGGDPPASCAPVGSVRGANQEEPKVSVPKGRHDPGGAGESGPCANAGGSGRARRAGEGGLLVLSGGLGRGVVHELMELEVDRVRRSEGQARPRSRSGPSRPRERSMTLGGRRVQVQRPRIARGRRRARAAGSAVRVLRRARPADAGGDGPDARRRVHRRFARVGEPVGEEVERSSSSTSKTSVSELFVERTRTALGAVGGPRRARMSSQPP